ncbi:hypothetical protein EDB84DRAFT_1442642, partial [Lactarius hengduanensis]
MENGTRGRTANYKRMARGFPVVPIGVVKRGREGAPGGPGVQQTTGVRVGVRMSKVGPMFGLASEGLTTVHGQWETKTKLPPSIGSEGWVESWCDWCFATSALPCLFGPPPKGHGTLKRGLYTTVDLLIMHGGCNAYISYAWILAGNTYYGRHRSPERFWFMFQLFGGNLTAFLSIPWPILTETPTCDVTRKWHTCTMILAALKAAEH